MTLAPGSRLGAFEVQAPLGAGGMGEVWRARDTRLGRDVAIKALPEAFARDPERLARFEREARLLASLSHPNIAGIYGLEEVEGHRYLVLEYVEGDTLGERIARGPLPVEDALDVCRQIAAAVETAHESGVIHRDLKPANVKLTPAGEVKVLDFGLAKGSGPGEGPVSSPSMSHSPTVVLSMTGAGVVLGTAAYMSPEQARGKPVDRRTDIWSFGCVLYECLTGRQLFEGETVSDLIARILEREPDWAALPQGTPSKVRDLLRRCLEKDPKRRMRDIGDARLELEEAIAARASASRSGPVPVAAAGARAGAPGGRLGWVLAGVFAAVSLALGVAALRPRTSGAPVRFALQAPQGTTLEGDAMAFAISPDGRTLVFNAPDSTSTGHLWVRALDALEPRLLAGTDNPLMPFWSPDGKWIGFFADGKLKKIPAAGGEVEVLADANNGRGGTWSRDGVIVFAPAGAGPLLKIAHPGDTPVQVTHLDAALKQNGHRYPCFLPDGKHFLYAALPPRQGRIDVFAGSIDGGAARPIGSFDACPVYVDPGYLLYLRGQTVVAQRFDAGQLKTQGDPVPLGENPGPTQYSGSPSFSASPAGVLVTLGGSLPNTDLVMSYRDGRPPVRLPAPPGRYEGEDFSPDGKSLVLLKNDNRTTQDLWLYDLERSTLSRFTSGPGVKSNPFWSPDGKRIAYSCDKDGPANVYVKEVGGSGQETAIFTSSTPFKYPGRWGADSRTLVVETLEEKTGWDLWTVSLDGPKPVKYLESPFNERWPAISPDGHWLSYTSDESGKWEVYLQSFPVAGEKHQVSTAGGFFGVWRSDGKQLAFYSPDVAACLVVDVRTSPALSVGTPRPLYRVPPGVQTAGLSPDLDRMVTPVPSAAHAATSLDVLLHWDALSEQKGK